MSARQGEADRGKQREWQREESVIILKHNLYISFFVYIHIYNSIPAFVGTFLLMTFVKL